MSRRTRYFFDTEFLEDGRTIELISIGIVAEDGREFYAEVELPETTWERIYAHEWLPENVVPHLLGVQTHRDLLRDQVRSFITGRPEFWAYCGAYDWVVLNQLYGPMAGHPSSWPFYTNDIAQLALHKGVSRRDFPEMKGSAHHALADARWNAEVYAWLMGGGS